MMQVITRANLHFWQLMIAGRNHRNAATGTNLLPLSDAGSQQNLAARLALPPQAVSAMDGYAVRGEDVSSPVS